MRTIVFILMCVSIAQLKAQHHVVGDWELYDTLSFSQAKLGNNILNKVKLIHKQLTLNPDSTFSIKHIEPKGFSINADVSGTWKVNNEEVILSFENVYENQNGERKKEWVKEQLTITDETKLRVELQQGVFYYIKKTNE